MGRQLWREKLETTIHNAGMFDLRDWLRASERIKGLDRSNRVAREEFTGHPVQDTFFSLVKSDPKVAQDVKPGLQPLGDLLDRAMETPNFKQLHEACRGDAVAAGMAAPEFFSEFVKNLPEDVKEQAQEARKAQHTADESTAQAQAAMTASEAYEEQAQALEAQSDAALAEAQQHKDLGNTSSAGAAIEKGNQLMDAAMDAQAEADRLAELAQALESLGKNMADTAQAHAELTKENIADNEAQIAHAANQAARQADDKARQALAFVKGFSQAAGGDPQNMDPEALEYGMELFRRFPQVADFAKILGWTKRVAKAEYRDSPKGRTEFKGYKVGELDVSQMAPQEWAGALVGIETLRKDWVRRVVDGEIAHNDYEGKEEQGRGPIIWVEDQSGSMSGEPAMMAKCLEWALIDIARADGREFHSIAFAGQGRTTYWKAPAKADYKGLYNHMQAFLSGGTDPYPPLCEALDLIEDGDLKADIVLTTDGIFDDPPALFLKELEFAQARRPLRIETVLVDTAQVDTHKANQFSDRLTNLSSFLRDKDRIRDILKAVV